MSDVGAAGHARIIQDPSIALLTALTVGVGVLVANLYYAQPLIASIGPEIGISPDLAGSIVSITQIGYGTGLFLLVPVADLGSVDKVLHPYPCGGDIEEAEE